MVREIIFTSLILFGAMLLGAGISFHTVSMQDIRHAVKVCKPHGGLDLISQTKYYCKTVTIERQRDVLNLTSK